MKRSAFLLVILAGALVVTTALAGSICGTVYDRMTTEPVPQAGVFVRYPTGEYTGLHAATNDLGFFCVDLVPIGSWDLEVRVDNYQVTYRRAIEVTEGPTSVDFELESSLFSFAVLWPSPTQSRVTFQLQIGKATQVTLKVYDLAGRLVREWSDPAAEPGERLFDWDLQDRQGRTVSAGVYLVRFSAGDVRIVRKMVVVR